MTRSADNSYTATNVFEWSGFRNGPVNPLALSESSILAGENVDAGQGYIRARGGWETAASPLCEAGSPEAEASACEVRALCQKYFAGSGKSYVFAQVRDAVGRDHLRVCPADRAAGSAPSAWTELAAIDAEARPLSIAVLQDRAVITEGAGSVPLVFPGCLSDDGVDWAAPQAVLVSVNAGADWSDATEVLCDPDANTSVSLAGLQPGTGMLAVCLDLPQIAGFFLGVTPGASAAQGMVVEGYTDGWTAGAGWIDHTNGLTQSGPVLYAAGVFTAAYHIENDIPGFWFRFRWTAATPAGLALTHMRFKAPCQPLPVVGETAGGPPTCFIYWDDSDKSAKDFTSEVSDESPATYARLNDGADSPTGMNSADALYVCASRPFFAVDITPHNDFNNRSASAASAAYWNGTQWTAVSGFSDKTQEPAGKSFAKKGRLSWNLPQDWRENSPISPQFPKGYWIRLKVSSNLTVKTYLTHVRVWPQPAALKKYRYAIALRDRMILCGRSDAQDAVDVSRPLDPTGFTGRNFLAARLGGAGAMCAAVEAFNQAYLAQRDNWIIVNHQGNELSVERAETAGQTPINNQVVVRAPRTEADFTNIMALYYLNQSGAWCFSGAKLYKISQDVSWWTPGGAPPRLDLESLAAACGAFWAQENRVVWAVPMTMDGSPQSRNNRLIIYDLNRKRWLPPFTVSAASLTVASLDDRAGGAEDYSPGLYAGDYSGRIIRLFGPTADTDGGATVQAWLETGWLHLGAPHSIKIIRRIALFGWSAAKPVVMTIAVDGDTSHVVSLEFPLPSAKAERFFAATHAETNITGQFFRFRLDFEGPTEIYGLQIASSVVRQWPAG
ncbi:MAG: hypothetical protein ACP5LD_10990 [Desulfomonilaceae bacterium]